MSKKIEDYSAICIRVGELPDDFITVLTDLTNRDWAPQDCLQVYDLPVDAHFDELYELCVHDDNCCWLAADYEKAAGYIVAMSRGDIFPPLIVDTFRGLLRDGYHRLFALKHLGVSRYPMILLDRLEDIGCVTAKS